MNPSGTTQLTCLLGSPVAHSISPKMHNLSFEELGLDFSYMAFDVKEEEIGKAVEALRLLNAKGFNLTMPLKRAIIPYLDEISDSAALSESVNTCVFRDGKLCGYTTDGLGFLKALLDKGIEYKGSVITMLGAGGAATSVITEAAVQGAKEIFIFKRKNASFNSVVEYASKVQAKTGCKLTVMDMADSEALKNCLAKSQILINGTNVGMGEDDTSLVPVEYLYKELIVTDLIYHPSKTRLLKDAEALGCKIMNGKYMLLFQGAEAFKIWTGKEMPVELIKKECFEEE